MAEVTFDRAIKALVLMILLVVFFFFFFRQVVVQYSEELTNTAKTVQKAEKIEMPTFSICSGFKKSLFAEYNISPMIFTIPPSSDTNLSSNVTLRTLFEDLAFKLNREFIIRMSFIIMGGDISEPISLELGINEIKTENSIYKLEVREFPTNIVGMCYVIIPIGISITVCL